MDKSEVEAFVNWTDRLKKKIRSLRKKDKNSVKAGELEKHLELIEGERAGEAPLSDPALDYQKLVIHFDFLHMLWGALQDNECDLI